MSQASSPPSGFLMRVTREYLFLVIVVVALMVRIGVVFFLSPVLDRSNTPSIDALSYHQIAQNLIQHQIFTSVIDPPYNVNVPGTFRPPLTPLYLAAWYLLCGVNLLWGRIGLAIISSLSCGLTYCVGERVFGRVYGVAAGMLSIGYPFFILLVLLPLTEGLSIFLSVLLVYLLYRSYSREKTWKQLLGVGVVLGLLLLNKAANITVMPAILLWGLSPDLTSWKKGLLNTGIVVIFAALMIIPWTLRNYRVSGTFIPINSNGGWTLYLGNNPYTEQNLEALEQGKANGWVPPKEVFIPFSDLTFTDTAAWERRSIQLARVFIREDPVRFFQLAWRKVKIFWSPYNHIIDKITWIPSLLLSLLGMYCSRATWRRQFLLYILIISAMFIPVFFTSMPRFRAPIMPFLLLYSAVGLVHLYSLGRQLIGANRD